MIDGFAMPNVSSLSLTMSAAPPPVALDSYASIVFMMSKFTIVYSCPDELLISWIDDESLEFLVKLLPA